MTSLESEIDDLYSRPLEEFVTARTALAKTLSGDDAKRVKALKKPTIVPWAANQLFWHGRIAYDKLARAGQQLREAQVAALEGTKSKAADLADAEQAHRKALADAVTKAVALAGESGATVAADELSRTLEAISLHPQGGEAPGRLTKAIAPAGFEALLGVTVKPGARVLAMPEPPPKEAARSGESARERKQREREEAEESARAAAIVKAEGVLFRAQAAEGRAREEWQKAKRQLEDAEGALAALKKQSST